MAASDVRIAVIGVGNVGRTFIRGIEYYGKSRNADGLWHRQVGGLKASQVKVVAAFDIDPDKVGKSLSQIIAKDGPNGRSLGESKISLKVSPGLLSDSDILAAGQESQVTKPVTASQKGFIEMLRKEKVDVALNLISSGLDKTSAQYAYASLDAGVAFVNATPAKVASNSSIASKFAAKNLVVAGDDLLSQLGGTAFHKGMIDFMVERGVHVRKSYQLDVGGSEETRKTMVEKIRMQKRAMKTDSISIEAPYKFESVAGTTEYTDFLGDSRNSYYWMSSEGFLGSEIIMDLTLRTNDGPNAGNVLLDVVRAIGSPSKTRKQTAATLKRKSEIISAYGFKSPPKEFRIREAYSNFVKEFVQLSKE